MTEVRALTEVWAITVPGTLLDALSAPELFLWRLIQADPDLSGQYLKTMFLGGGRLFSIPAPHQRI